MSSGGDTAGALLEDGVFLKEAMEEGGLFPLTTTFRLLVMWLLAVERTSRLFCGDADLGDTTLIESDFFPLI